MSDDYEKQNARVRARRQRNGRPGRGRPALPVHERKDVFTLRLTSDELWALESAAEGAGMAVRKWARKQLLIAADAWEEFGDA